MTDTDTEQDASAAEPSEDDAPADNSDTDEGQGSANGEAARYRRRLRDTETERDTLKARLETLQRGEVERLIADRFADPADIWRDGATLDILLDDDGNIDAKRVTDLATSLLDSHQHWGITKTSTRRAGLKSGASASTQPKSNAFVEAFKPRER